MSGRAAVFWLVTIVGIVAWWYHVPGAEGRFEAMTIDAEAGRIELDGVTYTAEFGESVLHSGDVRLIQVVAHDPAPIITHELVLTTGQYSDPEFAKIEPWGAGTVRVEAPQVPEGTLTMLHLIPANAAVVQALDALPEGASAQIAGRNVVGAKIENSDGGWIRLTHANHAMLLIEAVSVN